MGEKKRIIVSVTNDLYSDQRVHKVCTFLNENGMQVLLVGRKKRNSPDLAPRAYSTKRFKLLFERGAAFYACYNLRLFFFLLFSKADLLLSNDLDTLLANYCAKRFRKKCALIYDTHELFTEVPELASAPKKRAVWLKIERSIFPKLKKTYTVNTSIAAIYEEKYGVKVNVVRNVAPRWTPKEILDRSALGLPKDKKIVILQGAGINVDRGAEEAVAAMEFIENTVLAIVGSGDIISQLKKYVKAKKLDEKVLFFDRHPYEKLMQFTANADLGLSLDKDTNANYRFSLPNKVFDYLQAGTPILASNLVEIKHVIEKHDIGKITTSHEPKEIAKHINEILFDEHRLKTLKSNCLIASKSENWEKESQLLKPIFEIA